MANVFSSIVEQARLTSQALIEYGHNLFEPTVRLGVTGLSRAGKTVFITALVHGLLRGGRFPVFEAMASGRIARARLAPQPDDTVPRFAYEAHLAQLLSERQWPDSTRQISELRLIIEYQSQNRAMRALTLDIVDYPGEWLLDLPLLRQSYEDWSAETIRLSGIPFVRRTPLTHSASTTMRSTVESTRAISAWRRRMSVERRSAVHPPPDSPAWAMASPIGSGVDASMRLTVRLSPRPWSVQAVQVRCARRPSQTSVPHRSNVPR